MKTHTTGFSTGREWRTAGPYYGENPLHEVDAAEFRRQLEQDAFEGYLSPARVYVLGQIFNKKERIMTDRRAGPRKQGWNSQSSVLFKGIPRDGTYSKVPNNYGRIYVQYTEGPGDKAFIEAEERKYLRCLMQHDLSLFLNEMTPKSELSTDDKSGAPPTVGLDLSLEHHRNLQTEFAADFARIKAARDGVDTGSDIAVSNDPAPLRAEIARLQTQLTTQAEEFKTDNDALIQRLVAAKAMTTGNAEQHAAREGALMATLTEQAERIAELEREALVTRQALTDIQTQADRLREERDAIAGEAMHLTAIVNALPQHPPAATMISAEESRKALLRIWRGKYTPAAVAPQFTAVAKKEDGSSVGFIAQKTPTKPSRTGAGKRWMAKLGLPNQAHQVSETLTTRRRDYQRTIMTVVKEKIAADVYAILGYDAFYVPKHRLAKLPILNDYTRENVLAVALMEELNRNRAPETQVVEGVHLLSKWIEGYQDLAQLKDCVVGNVHRDFAACLAIHQVPEAVLVEGQQVPLLGLMEVLAVSRLLGDTDVLGGGLKNAGFVVERNGDGQPLAIRVVKIDAGESFNFRGEDNQLIQAFNPVSLSTQLPTKQDLQFGNNQPLIIQWESLSAAQKNRFLQTLQKGLTYLNDQAHLELLIRRQGEFDQAETGGHPLLSEAMVTEFKAHWLAYLKIQGRADVYGALLQALTPTPLAVAFAPHRVGAVNYGPVEAKSEGPVNG